MNLSGERIIQRVGGAVSQTRSVDDMEMGYMIVERIGPGKDGFKRLAEGERTTDTPLLATFTD